MNDEIKAEDIFDPNFAKQFKAEIDSVKLSVDGLAKGITNLKSTQTSMGVNPLNSSSDFKKASNDIALSYKQQAAAQKLQTQATIEALKVERAHQKSIEDKAKAQAKATKETEKSTSAYSQLNEQYKKAAKSAKDLSAEFGINSTQAKEASAGALELHQKLLAIDQAVGQSQRNVGNYEHALIKLSKGLRGLGGLGKILADSLGIDTSIVDTVREAGRAVKDFAHSEELGTLASGEHKAAIEAEIIVEKEQSALANISLGIWGLIAVGIGAAAFAIYEWTKGVGDSTQAWANNNETIKKSKEEIVKLNDEIAKTNIEIDLQKGKITQLQAKRKELDLDFQGNLVGAVQKAREERKKIVEEESSFMKQSWDAIKNFILPGSGTVDRAVQVAMKVAKVDKQLGKELDKHEELNKKKFELDKIVEAKKKTIVNYEDNAEFERHQSRLKLLKEETTNKKKQLDIQLEIDMEANQQSEKDLEVKANDEKAIIEKYYKDVEALEIEGNGKMIEVKKLKGKLDDEDYVKHRELLKKQKEERLKQEQEVLDFTEEALRRKNKLTEDQLNNDLDMRKRNIEQQQQLAIAGRANTLAFQEAAAAKDELKKQQLAIKEQKQAKAIALFRLLASAAEHGKDAPQALAEALVAIGIAGAISGSYYEGTENIGKDLAGNKMHNGRDGYLIAADGSERIMTGEQNRMIGDMSNEELANLARRYQMGDIPFIPVNNSNALLIAQFGTLTDEIRDIKQALRERPTTNIELTKLGDVVETKIANGFKKITTHKNTNNFI